MDVTPPHMCVHRSVNLKNVCIEFDGTEDNLYASISTQAMRAYAHHSTMPVSHRMPNRAV